MLPLIVVVQSHIAPAHRPLPSPHNTHHTPTPTSHRPAPTRHRVTLATTLGRWLGSQCVRLSEQHEHLQWTPHTYSTNHTPTATHTHTTGNTPTHNAAARTHTRCGAQLATRNSPTQALAGFGHKASVIPSTGSITQCTALLGCSLGAYNTQRWRGDRGVASVYAPAAMRLLSVCVCAL